MGCCGSRTNSIDSIALDFKSMVQDKMVWAHEAELRTQDAAKNSPVIRVCVTEPIELVRPVIEIKAMETVGRLLERIVEELLCPLCAELEVHHYSRLQLRVGGSIVDHKVRLDEAVAVFAQQDVSQAIRQNREVAQDRVDVHAATQRGDMSWLEREPHRLHEVNAEGNCPLITVVKTKKGKHQGDLVQMLLDAKASPDVKDAAGCSALFLALFSPSRSRAVASVLGGADAELTLEVQLEQLEELMDNLEAIKIAEKVDVHLAMARGDVSWLDWMPERVHEHDRFSATPLHVAARDDSVTTSHLLLEDDWVWCVAPQSSGDYWIQPDLCQFLVDANADVNAIDGMGCTPLYYAKLKRHPEVVEVLARNGGESFRKASRNKKRK